MNSVRGRVNHWNKLSKRNQFNSQNYLLLLRDFSLRYKNTVLETTSESYQFLHSNLSLIIKETKLNDSWQVNQNTNNHPKKNPLNLISNRTRHHLKPIHYQPKNTHSPLHLHTPTHKNTPLIVSPPSPDEEKTTNQPTPLLALSSKSIQVSLDALFSILLACLLAERSNRR